MEEPKMSVIITIYNIERYIGECLDSILNQDIDDLEVICVDDASTDNSYKVLKEYEKKDKRIQIIENKINKGQASSRNIGCKIAQGKYLYVMDGDDWLIPGALRKLYDNAETEKLDILTFSAESFSDSKSMETLGKRMKEFYIRKHIYQNVMSGAELFSELIDNNDVHGNICLQFINREFFVQNNLYWIDGLRYCEDDPFAMYMKAKRTKCIQDVLYMRRVREDSMITSPKKLCYLESALIQFAYDLQIWQSSHLSAEQNKKIEKHFLEMHRFILSLYGQFKDSKAEMPLLEEYPVAKYIYNYFIKNKPIICKNLTSDVLRDFSGNKNIIVYGAGKIAGEVTKILKEHGINDYVIAVSDKKDNDTKFDNRDVHDIDELADMRSDAVVLIATVQRHYQAIYEKLRSLGFEQIIYVD